MGTPSVMSILDKSRAVAPRGYSRWLVPPAALATHLAIGQIYAFSVFKEPLQERFDASHTAIGATFSIAIVVLGLSAAFGGSWINKQGPRASIVLAAIFWVTGYLVAALGVQTGMLWLFYVGYGVFGGVGLGIGYVAPVATLMRWFPDRPGLATGMAVMGFGGGALLASPLATTMLSGFGRTEADSLAPTLVVFAALNVVLMLLGAAVIRTPHPDDEAAAPAAAVVASALPAGSSVSAKQALRTPQFWLLWFAFFAMISVGIGILENASPMIQNFFPSVTAATAAGFVGVLSLANMGGRIGWATLSDSIGRKTTFSVFVGIGAVASITLALVGATSVAVFVGVTFLIVSFYGGGFSTMPAYLRDLFGQRNVGVILGFVLTAWSAAGIVGPLIMNSLVDSREAAGISGDSLYVPSLWIFGGLLLLGLAAVSMVRKVSPHHYEQRSEVANSDAATDTSAVTERVSA